ncbi:hypothetical protein Psta_4471 [Pirellula staleyi DSM 6068]|uniref:Uncharacterized protein n=1 Tax=Pirellula staleyi (strain ATCC 27377 / DSM 6068 / ICPB 4128) TaxID=530564 RepID=D2R629_PIRSD|nr:hypothetical protein Psta_4471 [Pirellula staleyi DSM 6068]
MQCNLRNRWATIRPSQIFRRRKPYLVYFSKQVVTAQAILRKRHNASPYQLRKFFRQEEHTNCTEVNSPHSQQHRHSVSPHNDAPWESRWHVHQMPCPGLSPILDKRVKQIHYDHNTYQRASRVPDPKIGSPSLASPSTSTLLVAVRRTHCKTVQFLNFRSS